MSRNPGSTPSAATKGLRGDIPFVSLIYVNAFITGAVIMAFEMLGSRYLNPYFGGSIYTWGALIATVLGALMVGYFVGGWLADWMPSPRLLGSFIIVSCAYLSLMPGLADPMFRIIFENIEDVRLGSLSAAICLVFIPLSVLGIYSPFAIRLVLNETVLGETVLGETVLDLNGAGALLSSRPIFVSSCRLKRSANSSSASSRGDLKISRHRHKAPKRSSCLARIRVRRSLDGDELA